MSLTTYGPTKWGDIGTALTLKLEEAEKSRSGSGPRKFVVLERNDQGQLIGVKTTSDKNEATSMEEVANVVSEVHRNLVGKPEYQNSLIRLGKAFSSEKEKYYEEHSTFKAKIYDFFDLFSNVRETSKAIEMAMRRFEFLLNLDGLNTKFERNQIESSIEEDNLRTHLLPKTQIDESHNRSPSPNAAIQRQPRPATTVSAAGVIQPANGGLSNDMVQSRVKEQIDEQTHVALTAADVGAVARRKISSTPPPPPQADSSEVDDNVRTNSRSDSVAPPPPPAEPPDAEAEVTSARKNEADIKQANFQIINGKPRINGKEYNIVVIKGDKKIDITKISEEMRAKIVLAIAIEENSKKSSVHEKQVNIILAKDKNEIENLQVVDNNDAPRAAYKPELENRNRIKQLNESFTPFNQTIKKSNIKKVSDHLNDLQSKMDDLHKIILNSNDVVVIKRATELLHKLNEETKKITDGFKTYLDENYSGISKLKLPFLLIFNRELAANHKNISEKLNSIFDTRKQCSLALKDKIRILKETPEPVRIEEMRLDYQARTELEKNIDAAMNPKIDNILQFLPNDKKKEYKFQLQAAYRFAIINRLEKKGCKTDAQKQEALNKMVNSGEFENFIKEINKDLSEIPKIIDLLKSIAKLLPQQDSFKDKINNNLIKTNTQSALVTRELNLTAKYKCAILVHLEKKGIKNEKDLNAELVKIKVGRDQFIEETNKLTEEEIIKLSQDARALPRPGDKQMQAIDRLAREMVRATPKELTEENRKKIEEFSTVNLSEDQISNFISNFPENNACRFLNSNDCCSEMIADSIAMLFMPQISKRKIIEKLISEINKDDELKDLKIEVQIDEKPPKKIIFEIGASKCTPGIEAKLKKIAENVGPKEGLERTPVYGVAVRKDPQK